MMRVLVTGTTGQVGYELLRSLAPLGQVITADRQLMDLQSPDAIVAAVRRYEPHLIVNPAAYTAVDKAQAEPWLADQINADAPGILAEQAKRLGAAMIHYSTDYVYDGDKPSPYTEADATNPLGVYGRSKLQGELNVQDQLPSHLIFRTSWVYGARGKNFMLTMLRVAREGKHPRVVDDQHGAPTWARTIADCTAQVIARAYTLANFKPENLSAVLHERGGIYHLANAGQTTWCGFAKHIYALAPAELGVAQTQVTPIASADYPTPTRRPLNSVLSLRKLQNDWAVYPAQWDHALGQCLAQLERQ